MCPLQRLFPNKNCIVHGFFFIYTWKTFLELQNKIKCTSANQKFPPSSEFFFSNEKVENILCCVIRLKFIIFICILMSRSDGSMQIKKPNGNMETRAFCEQINKQTATEMMAVVHHTTGW